MSRPWTVPGVRVADRPRFRYRGAMLDVARHFFTVAEVERYIDQLALYKINTLHLHLSDDQGWRIVIDKLAAAGDLRREHRGRRRPRRLLHQGRLRGHRPLRGGPPYGDRPRDRQAQPHQRGARLVRRAQLRRRRAAAVHGTEVGFSSLCVPKELTYTLLDDVIGEIAAQAHGPYNHMGGDEAHSTPHEDYLTFINREQELVHKHGKAMMGWNEIAAADVAPGSVAQWWHTETGSEEGTELAARRSRSA